ncbi:hypothetical protein WJX84_008208 [Apatococcus fuscideae]|uniref:ETFB lysine methyltransferase n=1 Tax=Apatococcus fuscideae TaxID=2026836 RepID=A0AAW1T8G5_9CHLO
MSLPSFLLSKTLTSACNCCFLASSTAFLRPASCRLSPKRKRLSRRLAEPPCNSQRDTSISSVPRLVTNNKCTVGPLPGDTAGNLSDVLLELGAQSVSVQEHQPDGQEEQEIFADGDRIFWDLSEVVVYFRPDVDAGGIVKDAGAVLGMQDLAGRMEEVVDQDWQATILESYKPLQVTSGVWIIPAGMDPEDSGATNIFLRPGLAFGTGEHPTTQLCMGFLAEQSLHGASVLDFGSGSGVLAIAALKHGASSVVAVDNDGVAVQAARENAHLNDASSQMTCTHTRDYEDQKGQQYDGCIANILAGPLMELAPRISAAIKPGGWLALSGILASQAAEVQAAYGPRFKNWAMVTQEPWVLVHAVSSEDA